MLKIMGNFPPINYFIHACKLTKFNLGNWHFDSCKTKRFFGEMSTKREHDVSSTDDQIADSSQKRGKVDSEESLESEKTSVVEFQRKKCPYLDTVNRQKLDFDQQKVCSITLTNMNVYACLVCGKFFQGRGKTTPAYTHSVQMGHFVFMNLQDTRAFCLPDSYEIVDAALNDVKRCLAPVFSPDDISQLSSNTSLARDVHGVSYLPGFVGLNNLKCTDFLNVVLHALSHVRPLRNFFLLPLNYGEAAKYPLVRTFGEVMRKLWSKDNFKSVISPQDFMHVVSVESKKRFNIGQQVG